MRADGDGYTLVKIRSVTQTAHGASVLIEISPTNLIKWYLPHVPSFVKEGGTAMLILAEDDRLPHEREQAQSPAK